MNMPIKIALLSDLHYSTLGNMLIPERKNECAMFFLKRAVEYFRITGAPDLFIIAGDCVDAPSKEESFAHLKEIADYMAKAPAPSIIIPGNHDPAPEEFYRIIPRPPEYMDIKGMRFVPFPYDPERPGYNAFRENNALKLMEKSADGFSGRIAAIQHVPLNPPGCDDVTSPYNYENAEEVVSAMKKCGYSLSISGHWHPGDGQYEKDGITYITAPALCETPFRTLIITVGDDGKISTENLDSRLPDGTDFIDCHIHSRYAYCCENMTLEWTSKLMDIVNLSGAVVTEHSGHLLFRREHYWGGGSWFNDGMDSALLHDRSPEYFEHLISHDEKRIIHGLELDVDEKGRFLATDEMLAASKVRIGSVHHLPETQAADAPERFFFLVKSMIESRKINVLAHPFRAFAWDGVGQKPEHLFKPIAELLAKHSVAAEINFHHNKPSEEFCRICLEHGVKLSFGSDAHNLYELGFFMPHIDFVRRIGFNGNLKDILYSP